MTPNLEKPTTNRNRNHAAEAALCLACEQPASLGRYCPDCAEQVEQGRTERLERKANPRYRAIINRARAALGTLFKAQARRQAQAHQRPRSAPSPRRQAQRATTTGSDPPSDPDPEPAPPAATIAPINARWFAHWLSLAYPAAAGDGDGDAAPKAPKAPSPTERRLVAHVQTPLHLADYAENSPTPEVIEREAISTYMNAGEPPRFYRRRNQKRPDQGGPKSTQNPPIRESLNAPQRYKAPFGRSRASRAFDRRDLADPYETVATAFGHFYTLTASKSKGREPTDENPRELCDSVAQALARRGIYSLVIHAFTKPNSHDVQVLHVHAFANEPLPADFARAWRRDYGPKSTDCRKVRDHPADARRLADYCAAQAGGHAAGIAKAGGHSEVLTGHLTDAPALVGALLDPEPTPAGGEPETASERIGHLPSPAPGEDQPQGARSVDGIAMPTRARAALKDQGVKVRRAPEQETPAAIPPQLVEQLRAAIQAGAILDAMDALRAQGHTAAAIAAAYAEAQATPPSQPPTPPRPAPDQAQAGRGADPQQPQRPPQIPSTPSRTRHSRTRRGSPTTPAHRARPPPTPHR